jgi:hypothetical protein
LPWGVKYSSNAFATCDGSGAGVAFLGSGGEIMVTFFGFGLGLASGSAIMTGVTV